MVGVVGVADLVAAARVQLVVDLGVRVGVEGAHQRGPVLAHQEQQRVGELVAAVGVLLADRGLRGGLGAQDHAGGVPQLGHADPAAAGLLVHPHAEEDQLGAAAVVLQDVELGLAPARQLQGGAGPRREQGRAEHPGVRLAQALLARGDVGGHVGAGLGLAGCLVDAEGAAAGDVHGDDRDASLDGVERVRVHEEQVVVRVRDDRHGERPARGVEAAAVVDRQQRDGLRWFTCDSSASGRRVLAVAPGDRTGCHYPRHRSQHGTPGGHLASHLRPASHVLFPLPAPRSSAIKQTATRGEGGNFIWVPLDEAIVMHR